MLQIQQHPLIGVDATKFALRKVFSDCSLKEFCRKCEPKANVNAVYIELDCIEDVHSILNVMLVDKVGPNCIVDSYSSISAVFQYFVVAH